MRKYAIIAENDESEWEDIKGEVYHYPNTYRNILTPGCRVIYYKGKLRDLLYSESRLSDEPHYFGCAVIGESVNDPISNKGDLFCEIQSYEEFDHAVSFKINGDYVEKIPVSRKNNFWRFGVRETDKETYDRILSLTKINPLKKRPRKLPGLSGEFESTRKDGKKKLRYTAYYERNPFNRKKAIEIHGLSCKACQFNFEKKYGDIGAGYIHVHHVKPVSKLEGEVIIVPSIDLTVLCANCHAMIHRKKDQTLTLDELKQLILIYPQHINRKK